MAEGYLPLSLTVFRVDRPVPVDVWSDQGLLLLAEGHRVASPEQLRRLVAHRPMVKHSDYQALQAQGLAGALLRPGVSVTAEALAAPPARAAARARGDWAEPALAWPRLHTRLAACWHDPLPKVPAPPFAERLLELAGHLTDLADAHPDDSLFMLLQMLADPTLGYSATHAWLVALICHLTAAEAGVPAAERQTLCAAALTMNVGMSRLHDALARQKSALSPVQRAEILAHPQAGAQCLAEWGVADPLWLQLVREHHESPDGQGYPGGLTRLGTAQRLLHLADLYVARISPRANRSGLSPLSAVRNLYLEHPDDHLLPELLARHLGLYPPGSYVRLRNGETAVVVRRGRRANEPVVLAIVNAQGWPIAVPATRDTRQPAHAVHASVRAEEVRVRLDPVKILQRT